MKTYKVKCERRGRESFFEGTMPELVLIFASIKFESAAP